MIKKFRILLVFISLSLTLCLMSNTYSRYVADTVGNIEMLFAKWQILVNNNDVTDNTSSTINIVPVIEHSNYIDDNTVAPSSKGYFDVVINPENVQVSFSYTIDLALQNSNIPDLTITKYAILSNNYKNGDAINYIDLTGNQITNSLNFNHTVENFKFEPFTVRVYFEWFEGRTETKTEIMNDQADTNVAIDANTNNTKLNIQASISFEQALS